MCGNVGKAYAQPGQGCPIMLQHRHLQAVHAYSQPVVAVLSRDCAALPATTAERL